MKNTIAFILSIISLSVFAQPQVVDTKRFDFESSIPKDESIPSPKDFLGHELGASFILHAHIVEYCKNLAEARGGI